ncbi:MAG: hypothetical protein PWQ57_2783 [Desulfovibrionales bacterium]|nr:hypothetical protein [Desulfovibrionales bacterium]
MIPRTLRKEYEKYIANPAWKKIRDEAIESTYLEEPNGDPDRGNYHCEGCGWNFKKNELEVHHRHYRTLGNESRSDLAVVCAQCHAKLDSIRAKDGKYRSDKALYDARFDGYMTAVYGEGWEFRLDPSYYYDEFDEWSERKDEKEYL